MPTADTHHRCGEVHFCFRRAVGRRRCLLDFVTQTGYGEVHSLLLFLSGRNSFWIHTAIPPPRATFPPDFEV